MSPNVLLSGIPPMNKKTEDLELRLSQEEITLEGEEVYYQRVFTDKRDLKIRAKLIISLMKDDGYSPSVLNRVSLALGYLPERVRLRKTA
jgi:hypothetical protein